MENKILILKEYLNQNYDNYPLEIVGIIIVMMYDHIKMSCGSCSSSIFMIKNNTLYGWGRNNYGELGIGNVRNQNKCQKINLSNVNEIACGIFHTVVLLNNGDIYSCGMNTDGQLGYICEQNSIFQKVNLSNVILMSCGINYTIALTKSNKLYGWGCNICGQLSLGNYDNQIVPQEIKINIHNTIRSI